ncbi:hypothetical protein [Bradyrhizobium vignae]|nr:hypothetical protein [Bradyrhizobium vignae]
MNTWTGLFTESAGGQLGILMSALSAILAHRIASPLAPQDAYMIRYRVL